MRIRKSDNLKPLNTIYIITGPTAVGKTSLAIEWARAYDAEIVSCDSLLVYRGMDIGTAKPSAEELAAVPHHCIDLVEPGQPFNVAMYLEAAKQAVDSILARGRRVLVTGGSGFYLKGFLAPVVDEIAIPEEIETEVERLYRESGLQSVVAALKQHSPDDYQLLDLQNPRRVLPALKRCLATGLSISALRESIARAPYPFQDFDKHVLYLRRTIDDLTDRISRRTRIMLDAGLVAEVEQLLERGIERNPSASNSIGYREVIAYLKGDLERSMLEQTINANTLKLVKKQLKWFKHQIEFTHTADLDTGPPSVEGLFGDSLSQAR